MAEEIKVQHKRKKIEPLDDTGYTNITVAILGSVDAGKSSLVGVLTTGVLDDGNGLSRRSVFVHDHERESGRTSDISWKYIKDEESKRIVSFVDLAGHNKYLKTTISGLTTSYADFALICIGDKVTNMTKEHVILCNILNIPYVFVLNKDDLLPNVEHFRMVLQQTAKLVNKKQTFLPAKTTEDLDKFLNNRKVVLYIRNSNKTGIGLDLIRHTFRIFNPRERNLPDGLTIEHIYHVPGIGVVVSGYTGKTIQKNDVVYIGPFRHTKDKYVQLKVKSIHNDYRYEVGKLEAGKRGCLNIAIESKDKKYLKKGLIVSANKPDSVYKDFYASIYILHHHSTIKRGYNAIVHIGALREPVKILDIYNKNTGEELDLLRSGDYAIVHMEFLNNFNYIEKKQNIVFREGAVRGSGIILQQEDVKGLLKN